MQLNAEEIILDKILESLPIDLQVHCDYHTSSREMVLLSNGNLRHFLPKDGIFNIKKKPSLNNAFKSIYYIEYNNEDNIWREFDEEYIVDIKNFKDHNITVDDEIYINLIVSGEFRGKGLWIPLICRVRIDKPVK
jgi:hypothetical protein